METLTDFITEQVEGRLVRVGERPIDFERFLDLTDDGSWTELVNGVLIEKAMVGLDHESLLGWLRSVLAGYVERRRLGIVLGSRSAIRIHEYAARLPDMFFVRTERRDIVQQRATYGAPDLVIEIVSPKDRPSDAVTTEVDYRSIGVGEIVFIDLCAKSVRVLLRRDIGYEETTLRTGTWRSEAVEGFAVEVAWLLEEERPDILAMLTDLFAARS